MKLILILTFFCVNSLYFQQAQAAEPQKATNAKMTKEAADAKNKTQNKKIAKKQGPKLKPNEFSLNMGNKTTVFSTQTHEDLLLSQNCFKNGKPKCDAYTNSLKKPTEKPEDHMKSPFHNNFGAIHCGLIGGKGLIAKTPSGDESDFCLFKDGSMVDSWSAYYKTNPQAIQTK